MRALSTTRFLNVTKWQYPTWLLGQKWCRQGCSQRAYTVAIRLLQSRVTHQKIQLLFQLYLCKHCDIVQQFSKGASRNFWLALQTRVSGSSWSTSWRAFQGGGPPASPPFPAGASMPCVLRMELPKIFHLLKKKYWYRECLEITSMWEKLHQITAGLELTLAGQGQDQWVLYGEPGLSLLPKLGKPQVNPERLMRTEEAAGAAGLGEKRCPRSVGARSPFQCRMHPWL